VRTWRRESASGVRWHKTTVILIQYHFCALNFRCVFALDVQTGKVNRWTYSETGGLNTPILDRT